PLSLKSLRRWWSLRMSGLASYVPMLLLGASVMLGIGYVNTLETSLLLAKTLATYQRIEFLERFASQETQVDQIRDLSLSYERSLGMFGGGMLREYTKQFLSRLLQSQQAMRANKPSEKPPTSEQMRKELALEDIPLASTLKWRYLMIFLTAEA